MIRFNVQFKMVRETISMEKSHCRLGIVIILVSSWLSWLWFQQVHHIVAFLLLVLDCHFVERCHVIALFLDVSIE